MLISLSSKVNQVLKSLFVICSICISVSCATPYALKKTDPDALSRMPRNTQTEKYITENNLNYAIDKYDDDVYLVEKTDWQKSYLQLTRYVVVPVAFVFDVALVCILALGGAAAASPGFGSQPSYGYYGQPTMYSPSTLYAPPAIVSPAPVITAPYYDSYSFPGSQGEINWDNSTPDIAIPELSLKPRPLRSMNRHFSGDDYKYESSSGLQYEYDLNKPGDAMRYEIDIGAQMRDERITPSQQLRRERDSWRGEMGGGIKR